MQIVRACKLYFLEQRNKLVWHDFILGVTTFNSLCIQENKETSQNVYLVLNFSSILRKRSILLNISMWSPLEKLNSGKQLSKFIFQKHGELLLPKIKNKDLFFTFVFQQNEAFLQSYLLSLPNWFHTKKEIFVIEFILQHADFYK